MTRKELTNELTNKLRKEISDKFKKPTLFEIQNFISENGLSIDGEKFFYHYEANGWVVGKSKMKNWQMALRGWERRESEFKPKQQTNGYQKAGGEIPEYKLSDKFKQEHGVNDYIDGTATTILNTGIQHEHK